MKHYVLAVLAAAAMLTACSSEDGPPMSEKHMGQIQFAPFTETASRVGDVTWDNMNKFKVWGYNWSDDNGNPGTLIFPGVEVTKVNPSQFNQKWSYSPPVYWFYNTDYRFSAIYAEELNGQPLATLSGIGKNSYGSFNWDLTQTEGKYDVVWATQQKKTDNVTTLDVTPGTVHLTFNHPQARIAFMFVDNLGENYELRIKDLKLQGVVKAGRCELGGQPVPGTWPAPDQQPYAIWHAPEGTTGFETCDLPYGNNFNRTGNTIYSTWRYVIPAAPGTTETQNGTGALPINPYFVVEVYHYGEKQGEFVYNAQELLNWQTLVNGAQGIMQGYYYIWRFTFDKYNTDPKNMLYDIKFDVKVIDYQKASSIDFDAVVNNFASDENVDLNN